MAVRRLPGSPSSRSGSASQCELESRVKPSTSSSPIAIKDEAAIRGTIYQSWNTSDFMESSAVTSRESVSATSSRARDAALRCTAGCEIATTARSNSSRKAQGPTWNGCSRLLAVARATRGSTASAWSGRARAGAWNLSSSPGKRCNRGCGSVCNTSKVLIEVQGLTKFYGERHAIQDVTFSVPKGQVLGFLGPNGDGKSTTMRILTGFLGMSSGKVSIDGYDVFSHSLDARRRIGYLPETNPLYNEMRVAGFLDLMCRLRGVAPSMRRARIEHAMDVCGLESRRSAIATRRCKGHRPRAAPAHVSYPTPRAPLTATPT